MAIIQISKIQQRSGNLVDLPQLSEAQLGWANDAKRLFIGGTGNANTYNENIEVLTSYSDITFSQINGSEGNLDISSAASGQVLGYNGTNWVNKGGTAGGLINLGTVANVKLGGGTNGYVLQTDGLGNLSWVTQTGGGGGSGVPGGANTQIQFNDGTGNFSGNSGFTFNYITGAMDVPGALTTIGNVSAPRLISTIATGTAPFTITSTTQVANLNVATSGTSGTVTTAAQPNITSVGTLTSLTVTGNAAAGNLTTAGQLVSSIATGTAPLVVTSTTTVANLNVAVSTTAGTVTTNAQPNITSVGTLTSLTVSGQITNGNITTGANSTAGIITGNWSLSAGSKLNATYADLAEYYESDQNYEPGTVLAFGGDKEVTIAEDGTTKVAGVVSTNPAYVLNTACKGEHTVMLALQGRVPCKVRGNIKKGDMLISAGYGFARPAPFPVLGTVIGKSLENFDGIEGIIEVAVGRL
jgi:hypothetical protein